MDQYIPVTDIIAREILDSRGKPDCRSRGACRESFCRKGDGSFWGIDRKI